MYRADCLQCGSTNLVLELGASGALRILNVLRHDAIKRNAKRRRVSAVGDLLAGAERPEVLRLRERLAGTAGTGATVFARGWPAHRHNPAPISWRPTRPGR